MTSINLCAKRGETPFQLICSRYRLLRFWFIALLNRPCHSRLRRCWWHHKFVQMTGFSIASCVVLWFPRPVTLLGRSCPLPTWSSERPKCPQKSAPNVFFMSCVWCSKVNRATKSETQVEVGDEPTSTIEPTSTETKKRPRLDISQLTGGRDRKRGKTMFGILVGTLNKAKIEDKERSASEAVSTRWHTSYPDP